MWSLTSRSTRPTERWFRSATRWTWSWAYADEMSGSSPEPEEVTASGGTAAARTRYPGVELSLTTAALASSTDLISSLLSPDRLVAPERISRYRVLRLLVPRPLDGRGWNHLRSGAGVSWPFFSGRS